ncbi:hypothetical protein JCM11251_003587 [Rhodosporidiobolus azoricus]
MPQLPNDEVCPHPVLGYRTPVSVPVACSHDLLLPLIPGLLTSAAVAHRTQFLTQLGDLFASRKDKGSVFITQKRFTYTDPSTSASTSAAAPSAEGEGEEADVDMVDASADGEDHKEYPLLVRATDGNSGKDKDEKKKSKGKVNLSTIVLPSDYDSFTSSYHTLLRSVFSAGLRPKRKKTSAAALEAKKLAKRKARAGTPAPGAGAAAAGGGGGGGEGDELEPAAAAAKVGFVPRLPKVIGPRRGNGVKKRRRAEKRRERAVERIKAAKSRRGAGGQVE